MEIVTAPLYQNSKNEPSLKDSFVAVVFLLSDSAVSYTNIYICVYLKKYHDEKEEKETSCGIDFRISTGTVVRLGRLILIGNADGRWKVGRGIDFFLASERVACHSFEGFLHVHALLR